MEHLEDNGSSVNGCDRDVYTEVIKHQPASILDCSLHLSYSLCLQDLFQFDLNSAPAESQSVKSEIIAIIKL